MKTPFFKLSVLTLALAAGYAQAEDLPAEHKQELQNITVKGDISTRRVTTKKMDESTSTDMKDVLFNEPSINFGGGNATSQWVSIRGMGQDQIDMKVDNTYSDSQIFHHNGRFLLDPSLVKVVGVQKGTGSASAGIGATSGAIVAKTVDAADLLREGQNVGFKLNAGVSSNKGYNRGAAVYGRWGGLDALITGNWVTEKDYKAGNGYRSATGNKVNGSAIGQRGLLAKFAYNFNDGHRVELSHRQEKTYGTRNLREEFDFAQAGRSATNSPRYRILTQDTTNLAYEGKQLGALGSLKANVYTQTIKREEPSATETATNKIVTNGANVGFDTPLFDKHTLKYGVNWRKEKSKPDSLSGGRVREEKTDYGIYAEGIWDIAPVTLTTGVRYDHYKTLFSGNSKSSGSKVNPSIGVIWDATPDLSFSANLNYASRSPRLYEVMLSGSRTALADPNLKAERARNAEVGVKYKLNDALLIEANYFDQQIKDVQAWRSLGRGRFMAYNGGTLKNKGYEVSTSYRWRGLTARAGVAYNKPKINSTNIDSLVTFVPVGRTWTAGLSYQFDHPNLEIGWRGRFVQRTEHSAYQRGSGGGTARPGYGVNDIYLNWKPLPGKDNLNVNFAINNVGNKYYKSHTQRESTNGSSLPEAGRDVRLGMNYHW